MTPVRDADGPAPGVPGESGEDSISAQRVIRCAGTADFLAALPQMTGFTACDSLFIVLFTGNRTHGAMRVDLPPNDHPLTLMQFLDAVCALLIRAGAHTAPAFVITTAQSFADCGGAPRRDLAHALGQRLHREGFSPRELCCVAADGWVGFLHGEDSDPPRPLSAITRSSVAVTDDIRAPNIHSLGDLPRVSPLRRAAVRSELPHTEPPSLKLPGPGAVPPSAPRPGESFSPTSSWIRATTEEFEDTIRRHGSRELSPESCARMIHCAESSDHWLLLALTVVTSSERLMSLADALGADVFTGVRLNSRDDHSPREAAGEYELADLALALHRSSHSMHGLLRDVSSTTVPRERLQAAIDVAMLLAAYAPVTMRAGSLALAAWLWWMQGLQTVAVRLIEQAAENYPDHALITVVRRLVTHHIADRFTASLPTRDSYENNEL